MAGATRTTADSILKEFYLPGAQEQLNNDIPLLTYAEKNTKDIEGRRAILAPHTKRSAGIGARAEGGTLPTAGNQTWAEERIPVFYNYGRIQVSGPLMKSTGSDRGSFLRAVDAEMKGITNDLKRDVNRQCWGDGTGAIAGFAGTESTTATVVITLASTVGTTQAGQLDPGMTIDIGTTASPTLRSSANSVTSVDTTTAGAFKVTLGTAVTVSSTDFIFRSGNGGVVGSNQKEITGLQLTVDSTGTVFNVAPGTHPSWVSVENGNSGTNRSLTEPLMARVVMDIQIAGGEYPSIGIGSPGVYRAFANLQTSLKRFTNTRELQGGWVGLDFAAGTKPIPITSDRDCPNNQLYFLNTSYLTEFQVSDWEWMEEDGAVLSRVANNDAYEAVLFKYHELATPKRNAHGKIVDITEAT